MRTLMRLLAGLVRMLAGLVSGAIAAAARLAAGRLGGRAAPEPEVAPRAGDGGAGAASDEVRAEAADEGERAGLGPENVETTPDGRSVLDFDKFERALRAAADPAAELRLFVDDVRRREESGVDVLGQDRLRPGDLELFAARALEESGALGPGALPAVRVIRPLRSRTFYVRVEQPRVTRRQRTNVLRLENALNRVYFASQYFEDLSEVSTADAYLLNQRLEEVFCSQVPQMLRGVETGGAGEWDARLMLGVGVEAFQLPHRLTCSYRMNLRERIVAVRVDLPEPDQFASSCYLPHLGRVVPTTREMRERAASDYAMRLGILLAAFAFACSTSVNEVYVRGDADDGRHHRCLYSVCFDRTRFSAVDLSRLDSLPWHYRCFGARMRLDDGVLRPVEATFSLEEERFCPSSRFDSLETSHRMIAGGARDVLGTWRASDFGINEEARRAGLAEAIARELGDDVEDGVRAILAGAGDDPAPDVRDAVERTVRKLIEGTLPAGDPYAFAEEFVDGGELGTGVERAAELLAGGDAAAAARLLDRVIAEADASGAYRDDERRVWRCFRSYAERTLYNLEHGTGREVLLAPDAYQAAHLVAGAARLGMGQTERALSHARRALELGPYDTRPRLLAARCLEELDDFAGAAAELEAMLDRAYEPQGAGVGYYRMAYMQLRLDRPDLAEACYRKSLEFPSVARPVAGLELAALMGERGGARAMGPDEVDDALRAGGVGLVDVEGICRRAYECGRAAMDAGLFPVARSLANVLATFTGDDAVYDLVRSIEDEPDR